MKTLSFKMVFMMALVIGSAAFVSCSNDDENGSESGGMTSKRISKMTYSDGDHIEVTTFDYDAQGRVVKVNETNITANYESPTTTTTYTYSGSTIISGDHTYSLSNGRIIKDVEEYYDDRRERTYTYDSNGYLVSQESYISESTTRNIDFIWTDGNLTKYIRTTKTSDYSKTETYIISYSNISWPQNWMFYWSETSMDEILEPLGAFGKMPKNLPTKIVYVGSGGNEEQTFDYAINDNGEITQVTIQEKDDDETEYTTTMYTYEWE